MIPRRGYGSFGACVLPAILTRVLPARSTSTGDRADLCCNAAVNFGRSETCSELVACPIISHIVRLFEGGKKKKDQMPLARGFKGCLEVVMLMDGTATRQIDWKDPSGEAMEHQAYIRPQSLDKHRRSPFRERDTISSKGGKWNRVCLAGTHPICEQALGDQVS